MSGRFAQGVRFGVQVALRRFVDMLAGESSEDSGPRDTYLRLGAGEYRAGRSLAALLAAYRVGARLAWRRFVEAGTHAGFAPDALYDLGESIFAYIDEISAESAAGFAEAQSEAAGESQRRRRELVRLLVQEPPRDRGGRADGGADGGLDAAADGRRVVAGESEEPEKVDGVAARLARQLGPGAVGAAAAGWPSRSCLIPRAPAGARRWKPRSAARSRRSGRRWRGRRRRRACGGRRRRSGSRREDV